MTIKTLPPAAFRSIEPGEDSYDWHRHRKNQASILATPFLHATRFEEAETFLITREQSEIIAEALLYYARTS